MSKITSAPDRWVTFSMMQRNRLSVTFLNELTGMRNYPEQAREKADKGLFFWTIAREFPTLDWPTTKLRFLPLLFPEALRGC